MFQLDTEFYKLPLIFDSARLAEEVLQFREDEWRRHPQGHKGNSALPLISVGGGMNDEVKGPMLETPFLQRCPYLRQALASLRTVIGRARLMRIAGQADAVEHVDTNYYWMHHVRVHIPAVTYPEVRFMCNQKNVHMAPGETWIFDSWKPHNVFNPVETPRIHIVADTVGSGYFWELVARSEMPFLEGAEPAEAPALTPFRLGETPALDLETENFPVVMSPFEQQALTARMLSGLTAEYRQSAAGRALLRRLDALNRQWHALWTQYTDRADGWSHYIREISEFDRSLVELAPGVRLGNGVEIVEALRQAIVRPAHSPEVLEKRRLFLPGAAPVEQPPVSAPVPAPAAAQKAPSTPKRPQLDRPVFIVAAPRSGSTMLFELLSRSPQVWTIGGESHHVFEEIPALHPSARGFESNRLEAADATESVCAALREGFVSQLRDRLGQSTPIGTEAVRMLEKTPKNAMRIPFLAKAFPDARFIYLYREPAENLGSIIDAWKSGRFVTYRDLPDWEGAPWSLLLVPGWRALRGKSIPEIALHQWVSANRQILDDLAQIPADRWTAVEYSEAATQPQAVAKRLAQFAGWEWDQEINEPLPLSRHTLTPPAQGKWRAHEAAINALLPQTVDIAARAASALHHSATEKSAAAPIQPSPTEVNPAESAPLQPPLDFGSGHTASFCEILQQARASLAVSTYQAGKLILVRARDGLLNTHFRDFHSPMGVAWRGGWVALGTKHEVWKFRAFGGIGSQVDAEQPPDSVYLPATRYTTGDIQVHDLAWGAGNELWAVNTRFSCLCTFDGEYNFVPRWKPPFISALSAEDRCHLNGLAMVEGEPAYVTCHAMTDTPAGWRDHKANGGCIVEVATGEVIASGLCMPHSPRVYGGVLFYLESGYGRLSAIDLDSGQSKVVCELPGFTRGLDFIGPYAFVGLSQVRESAVFGGIPVSQREHDRHCGVWIVDIRNGHTAGFLKFTGSVQEIFSVNLLPGQVWPDLLNEPHDVVAGAFYVPPASLIEETEPEPAQELAVAAG